MKALPILAFLTAVIAFVFAPLSFELSGSLVVCTGFAAMLVADYSGRRARDLQLTAALSAPPAGKRSRHSVFRLAA